MQDKVGFIGLGKMGSGMAANVLKAMKALLVYDASAEAVQELVRQGATAASSIAQLAEQCDLILMSLPSTEVVEEVIFGQGALASHAKPGSLVVDFSTISYLGTVDISQRLAELKIGFVDAPVSGWPGKAKEGTLSLMVGGEETMLERAQPALEAVGNSILYMGKSGNGQLAKLVNQIIYNLNITAMAEVFPMAQKMGLDPQKVVDLTTKSACRSFALESFAPQILENRFDLNYPLQSAYKDMESIAGIISAKGIPMPLTQSLMTVYQMALSQGLGNEDKGALIKVYERLLGVEFRKQQTSGNP